jgi:hypothetical protein
MLVWKTRLIGSIKSGIRVFCFCATLAVLVVGHSVEGPSLLTLTLKPKTSTSTNMPDSRSDMYLSTLSLAPEQHARESRKPLKHLEATSNPNISSISTRNSTLLDHGWQTSTSSSTPHIFASLACRSRHFRPACDRYYFRPHQQQPTRFRSRRSRRAPPVDLIAPSRACATAHHVLRLHIGSTLILRRAVALNTT